MATSQEPGLKRSHPIVWHLVVLALCAAAPFAALVAYLAFEFVAHETSRTTQTVERYALSTADEASDIIDQARLILGSLAKRPAVAALDRDRCDPLLGEVLRLHPQFANVFTLDGAGQRVCSAVVPLADVPARDPRHYPDAASARTVFTVAKPFHDMLTGKWVVTAVQPIVSTQGRVTGVVGIALDLVALSSIINKRALAPGTVVEVLDSEGTIVTRHPDPEGGAGRAATSSLAGRAALARKAGTARAEGPLGVQGLWAFAPVPGTEWIVLAGISTEEALAPVHRATAWVVTLATLGVAFVIFLSMAIARPISRPIAAIAAAARRMSSGDSVERLEPSGPAEIAALADDLNGMVGRRIAAEQAVLDVNAGLERRVGERTAELEAANHELEAFDYSISHDLRAPLNRVRGFGEALAAGFGDRLGPEGLELLARIQASAASMDRLITDMLSLATLARGEVHRTEVDLGAMALHILDGFQLAEPERRVEVAVAGQLRVQADLGLIRIALENLLANAWKFSARRSPARIEVGSLSDGIQCWFYVRDNGAGFDPALAGRLFEPFRRLHSKSEFAGTGIGLATVQRILRRHGGSIRAESSVDHGATFYFLLPAPSIPPPG